MTSGLVAGSELEMCAAYFGSEAVDPQSRVEGGYVRRAYAALEEAGPSGLRPSELAALLQVRGAPTRLQPSHARLQ